MGDAARLPARLIVDLPNWVGDQIMALPCLTRLIAANQQGETVLYCRPPVLRLLQSVFPSVEVISAPRRTSILRAVRELKFRRERFDIGITMRHASRAKVLIRLISRHAIGSEGGGAELLLNRRFVVDRVRHQVHDSEAVLKLLGLQALDPGWRPQLSDNLVEEGQLALRGAEVLGEVVVGLAASAAWGVSKVWPAERFGLLACRLHERGLRSVVLVGPGEEAVAESVREAAGFDLPILGPSVDIAGLAGIMAGLSVVVANDSGPMHVSSLVGVPVVGLFGPTDPRRTGPLWGPQTHLGLGLECAPCLEPRCPLGHNDCLHRLEVGTVEDAVLEVVSSAVAV